MAFLACSEQWALKIAEGITISQVKESVLKPENHGGEILIASREDKAPLTLDLDEPKHEGHLEKAPEGTGRAEWLIRLSPGIETVSDGDGVLLLKAGAETKNICPFTNLAPGETGFVMAPVFPNNERTELEAKDKVEPFGISIADLACSNQWTLEIASESGIVLRKLKRSAFPPGDDKGEILSAKVRAGGTPILLVPNQTTHKARLSATQVGLDEWLIRLAEGIQVRSDGTGYRLIAQDTQKNIVAFELNVHGNKPSETAFLVSPVPSNKLRPINEADLEDIP